MDTMQSILDACTQHPACYLHDRGLPETGDMEEVTSRMCLDLVGRTEAILTHRGGFSIGDKVVRGSDAGEVIGFARGKDGRDCLVLTMEKGQWRTYLCPVNEARKVVYLTEADLVGIARQQLENFASGVEYSPEDAQDAAEYLAKVAKAVYRHLPMEAKEVRDG